MLPSGGDVAESEQLSSHRFHSHFTLTDKVKIENWMVSEVAQAKIDARIQSETIATFPEYFKTSQCVNFTSANCVWDKEKMMSANAPASEKRSQKLCFVSSVV